MSRQTIVSPTFLALCLVSVFAVGCGDGLSALERDKARIGQGKENLEAIGAKVEMEKFPQGDAWSVDLSGQTISDDTFNDLEKLNRIVYLNLSDTNFNDEMASRMNDTRKIRGLLLRLNLSNTDLTDAGLATFTETYLLMNLDLANTKVTEEGISALKERLPNVKVKN